MSLVITSSADVDETNQVGISIPYQYRNHLKHPLEVPPNSEVAVESIKIQRTPMLDYGNNIRTNFWFGERLTSDTAQESQTSYFIPVDNTILGSRSPQDFADEFKKVLQDAYSLHPEIDSEAIEVNIHLSSNEFAGFQFKIPQIGSDAASVIPSDDCRVQEMFGEATYESGTITADDDETFVQLLPQGDDGGPLSLHNGSCTFTDLAPDEIVAVGISRPYCNNLNRRDSAGNAEVCGFEDTTFNGALGDCPFSFALDAGGVGKDGDVFMDYCVYNDGTDIRVFNYGVTQGPFGKSGIMEEVVYYAKNPGADSINNGSNSSFATGSPIPSASMGDISFQVQNEKVKISVSGKILLEVNKFDSASFKDQLPYPTSIANWKMYPTVYFQDDTDDVTLSVYKCRTNSTIVNNFPENSWLVKSKIATFIDGRSEDRTSGDQQDREDPATNATTPAWNNANWWEYDLYQRRIFQGLTNELVYVGNGTIKDYKGLQSNAIMEDYENIFIMGRNQRYIDTRIEGWQSNSALTLGFSPFSINQDSNMIHGAFDGASFTSVVKPSLTSQQSTFIRVPTLTHETYNFNTGNPSKILFQIPRFDNSGAETGALYFQNNDKSFIDLKNAAPLRITDLDVHLVRKDETFAKDLTGSTEVVFVIRQKQKL